MPCHTGLSNPALAGSSRPLAGRAAPRQACTPVLLCNSATHAPRLGHRLAGFTDGEGEEGEDEGELSVEEVMLVVVVRVRVRAS